MPSPVASMSEVIGVGCGACGVCVCGVSIKGPSNDEIFLIVFLFSFLISGCAHTVGCPVIRS